jgi:hypothetical protein
MTAPRLPISPALRILVAGSGGAAAVGTATSESAAKRRPIFFSDEVIMGTVLKGKGILVAALAVCATMLGAAAPGARAQGSRKDDVVFNAQGRPMAGATVRVCQASATGQPCSPLAAIYSDPALTQALANPITTDGLGNYSFYAAPGRYMIEISGPGITTKQVPDVILPSDPSAPTFTSVTTTSGISAFSLSLAGNLTVNGSAAVTGSLTVGGAAVPSTSQDNQWTAGQRFKGPIPYRDVTAYMPAGGCSSLDTHDPQTTGSISTGSSALTLTAAMDFKNGCGITVIGAGPTSTLPAPGTCTVSSAVRASNVVTVTCSSTPNIPAGNWAGSFVSIVLASCSDGTMNGTHPVQVTTSTTLTFNSTGSNGSATSCTATLSWGYAHGATGSTTYDYKAAAIDRYFGYSAASPDIQITNGNATLDQFNYNWITWPPVADSFGNPARWYAIYRSTDGGSTWSCISTAFTNGYADEGLNVPCPVFMPATTPPAAAGPQALFTTISSGGGTTSLTLASNATTTATTQNVYHDESSFVKACTDDVVADNAAGPVTGGNGSFGCYIPSGRYFINGPMPTDALSCSPYTNPCAGGVHILVAGNLALLTTPWFFSSVNWDVEGVGFNGPSPSFGKFPTTVLTVGTNVPAGIVLRSGANNSEIDGFALSGLQGHGLWIGQTPGGSTGPSGVTFKRMVIGQSSTGGGANVWIDAQAFALHFDDTALTARSNGTGYDNVKVSMSSYNVGNECCFYFDNLSMVYRGFKFDAPGGNASGGGINSIFIRNAIVENLAPNSAGVYGLILHDYTANAPGTTTATLTLTGISVQNLNNSDAHDGPSAYTLFQENGSGASGVISSVNVQNSGSWRGLLSCAPQTTACNSSSPSISGLLSVNAGSGSRDSQGAGAVIDGTAVRVQEPLAISLPSGFFGGNPPNPAWAQLLPQPDQFQVNSTGTSGSLADATYCMAVEGKGANTDTSSNPLFTLPTRTICQAISGGGGAGNINVQWQQAGGNLNGAYAGFRFFFCSTAGSSCTPGTYIDLVGGGNPYTYNFTTASGAGGSLNSTPQASLSWLDWDRNTPSCLLCAASGSSLWPLGIGTLPTPGNGVKLDVNGGTIRGQGGLQAGTDAAFNASPRAAYNAFLPNLTSAAGTYQRMTLDKAVTVTRLQLVLGTPGAGCTTQATASVTDGTNSVTLTTANGTSIYDSGAVSQNFAAGANLDIKIATAASGCSTAPQNANITAQYRMQ